MLDCFKFYYTVLVILNDFDWISAYFCMIRVIRSTRVNRLRCPTLLMTVIDSLKIYTNRLSIELMNEGALIVNLHSSS
jgi:hypothetical protein